MVPGISNRGATSVRFARNQLTQVNTAAFKGMNALTNLFFVSESPDSTIERKIEWKNIQFFSIELKNSEALNIEMAESLPIDLSLSYYYPLDWIL